MVAPAVAAPVVAAVATGGALGAFKAELEQAHADAGLFSLDDWEFVTEEGAFQ